MATPAETPIVDAPAAVEAAASAEDVAQQPGTTEEHQQGSAGGAAAPSDAAASTTTASTASAVFSRTATFLSATKERVGSAVAGAVGNAQALAKNMTATRQSREAPAAGGAEAPQADAVPPAGERQPSALDQMVDEQHTRAVALAHSILDFSSEVSRKVEASVVRTRESTWRTYTSAVQSLRRLTAPSRRVAAVCKADLRTKPVPQVLLLCCNHVATQGLASGKLFQEPHPPAATVEALSQRLEDRLVLLPSDLDPAVAAAVITHFLSSLEEPLLTFKLVDRWVAAGKQLAAAEGANADSVHELLSNLPLANWSTLKLLVETLYRVASQSNVTGMNAQALSAVMAPVLLWREHPPVAAAAAAGTAPAAAARSGTSSSGTSSAQVVVAQASQMASATLQAIRSKIYSATTAAPAAAATTTPAPDATSPTAAAAATATTAAATAAAAGGDIPPASLPVSDAPPAPRAPRMVLDEDEEEDEEERSKRDTARLEQSVLHQEGAATKGAAGEGEPAAVGAAAAAEAAPAGGAGEKVAKVALDEEDLAAVAAVLCHVIMNYDDLFVLGP